LPFNRENTSAKCISMGGIFNMLLNIMIIWQKWAFINDLDYDHTRPISARYFNALYQVELISILYITHTNNSFVNELISMFYIKNTDSALMPYMIAHFQQTANIPSWVWSYSKADKESPRGLLSSARDSISHRTLVFILYPLHKICYWHFSYPACILNFLRIFEKNGRLHFSNQKEKLVAGLQKIM